MIRKVVTSLLLVTLAGMSFFSFGLQAAEKDTANKNNKLAVWGFAYMDQGSRSMCRYLKKDFPKIAKNTAGIQVIPLKETDKVVGDQQIATIAPNKSLQMAKEVGANAALWGMVSEIGSSLYSVRYFLMDTKTEEIKSEQLEIHKASKKRREKVKEIVNVVKEMLGSAAEKRMDIALNFFNSEQYEDAKQAFKRVLELDPNNVSAYNYLGYIAAVNGNYDEAINYYKQALEKDTEFTEAREGLAWTYKNNENYDKAIETYRKLAENNPKEISYWQNIGEIWKDRGNTTASIEAYKEIVNIEEDNVDAHKKLGLLYFERDQYEKAIPYLKYALQHNDNAGTIAKKLAISYQKTDRIDECIQQNQALVEDNPNSTTPYLNLAVAFVQKEQFSKAIEALKKYIELRPNCISGYQRIADVYRQQGKFDKAIQNAQKAAEIAPNDPAPYMILAEIDNSRGYSHYEDYLKYDKKAREATQKTYDKFDKLRSKNKKAAHNYFLSAKEYYKKALSLCSDFFQKENLQKKIETTNELIEETKPGFFDG